MILAWAGCFALLPGCATGMEQSPATEHTPASGQSPATEQTCPPGYRPHLEFQLIFPLATDAGQPIAESDWQAFQAEVIFPRFPGGMTVTDGVSDWRDSDGSIRQSRVRIVRGLLADPDGDGARLVDEISDELARRLGQSQVFRIVNPVCSGVR